MLIFQAMVAEFTSASYMANIGWSTKGRTEELHLREQC
jgi:hypothetical protein